MPIDAELVHALVKDRFPQWAGLEVRPVPVQGNDNRTFRLGDDLAVRLPSGEGYVAGIAKEDDALPLLARHIEISVPVPVATGAPGHGFAWPWSVRRWLDGVAPEDDRDLDRVALAQAAKPRRDDMNRRRPHRRRSVPTAGPRACGHA